MIKVSGIERGKRIQTVIKLVTITKCVVSGDCFDKNPKMSAQKQSSGAT